MSNEKRSAHGGKRWFLGGLLALGCCALGGLFATLAIEPEELAVPPFWWGVASSALPSLLAGGLLSRYLVQSQRVQLLGQDPLTGLLGEAQLKASLGAEFARAKREAKRLGVIVADLDQSGRFDVAHYVAWRAMARTLKQGVRLTDQAYVLGPGRFAVLLSATLPEGGGVVLKRLRQAIRDVPELYGVQIRFGEYSINPAEDQETPVARILEAAIQKARAAAVETTLPVRSREPLLEGDAC